MRTSSFEREITLAGIMPTYRADINAANDNAIRRRRAIWLGLITFLLIGVTIAFAFGRQFVLGGIPQLPDKAQMWELNLEPNYTLVDKNGHIISHRGPFIWTPSKNIRATAIPT